MKIYISGKISGLPFSEVEKTFKNTEARLKKLGFEVVNPIKKNISTNASWTEHMRMDIKLLMDCDTIYMQRNYKHSKGAMIEYSLAKRLGYTVIHQLTQTEDNKGDEIDLEDLVPEFSGGICNVCDCTEDNACCHSDYGPCWWVDDNENLCSHCADASYENSIAAMQLADNDSEKF